MNRKVLFAAAIIAGVYAAPASAQVVIDASMITCKDFALQDPETQSLVASWLSGFFSASKNLNVFQTAYFKRNKAKVGGYCKTHPNETLMSVIEKTAH